MKEHLCRQSGGQLLINAFIFRTNPSASVELQPSGLSTCSGLPIASHFWGVSSLEDNQSRCQLVRPGYHWLLRAGGGSSCRCRLCVTGLFLRLSLRLQHRRTRCVLPPLPFTNMDAPAPWGKQTEVWRFQSVRMSSQNFHLGATAVKGVWPDSFLFFCCNPRARRDAAAQQSSRAR